MRNFIVLFAATALLLFMSGELRAQHEPRMVMPERAASKIPRPVSSEPTRDSQLEIGRSFLPPTNPPVSPPGVEVIMEKELPATADGLTIEGLLSLAMQHNPTLVQAQQQINGTFGKAIEAGLYPNPIMSYMGDQIFVDTQNKKNTAGEFQGGIIQQEIVTGRKLQLSREKYLQRTKVAEFEAVAQQWRVCNDVRMHFWKALGQQQTVSIRRELVKAAEDSALTTREQYQLGQSTRSDLHRANVTLQKTRLDLLNAENEYVGVFRELTSLVGMELSPEPLQGNFESEVTELIDFDVELARYHSESPEILAARAKWRGDHVQLERERVQPIPNIIVRGGVGHNFEVNDTVATAGVSVSVPLFDRNQGTIRQAEADLARQGAEIRRIELQLRSDLAKHFQNYQIAIQNVTQYRDAILPEAKAAYADQLEAYKQDRQNWMDILISQREYYLLREEYVHLLVAWRTNETLIQGFLLHGGLMAAPSPTPPGHIDATPKPR